MTQEVVFNHSMSHGSLMHPHLSELDALDELDLAIVIALFLGPLREPF